MEGRKLFCKPCLNGKALRNSIRQDNKRKIIVKGVPHFVTEEDVKYILESTFGKINNLYSFIPSGSKEQRPSLNAFRSFRVFSISFADRKHASSAAFQQYIEMVPGWTSVIES